MSSLNNNFTSFKKVNSYNVKKDQLGLLRSKSIYHLYLTKGLCSIEHDRLSSIYNESKNYKNNEDNQKQLNIEENEFRYTVEGTNFEARKKLYTLQNIEDTDVILWVSKFRSLMNLSKWEDESALCILKSITAFELHEKIFSHKCNIQRALNNILLLKFPPEKIRQFQSEINSIYQHNFFTIKGYVNKIDEVLQKLSISGNWSSTKSRDKREDIFWENLTENTSLDLTKAKIKNIEEAIDYIGTVENQIIANTKTGSQKSIKISTLEKKNDINTLFCNYHKKGDHNSENCQKYQEFLKKRNKKENNKCKKINHEENFTEMFGIINEKHEKFILDTGSDLSYISNDIVNKYNLDIHEIEPIKVTIADGKKLDIDKYTILEFSLMIKSQKKFQHKFHIIHSEPQEIILGTDFMIKNKIQIDFSNKKIKIAENQNEEEVSDRVLQLDEELMNKINITKHQELKDQSKTVICKNTLSLLKKNPAFGCIE